MSDAKIFPLDHLSPCPQSKTDLQPRLALTTSEHVSSFYYNSPLSTEAIFDKNLAVFENCEILSPVFVERTGVAAVAPPVYVHVSDFASGRHKKHPSFIFRAGQNHTNPMQSIGDGGNVVIYQNL